MNNNLSPNTFKKSMKMLGFSDDEILILSTFLSEDEMTPYEASKNTGISHSNSSFIITKLVRQGIIRDVLNNGSESIYKMCSKKEFLNWIEDKKIENSKIYDNASLDVNMFFNNIDELSWKPNVSYYEGREGIIEIYEDIITTGEDVYGWTDIEKIYNMIGNHMYKYIEGRILKGMNSYAIMTKNKKNTEFENTGKKGEKRFVRFNDNLPVDGEIRIFGDKVAIIDFKEEKGFIIKSTIISSLLISIFKNAWKDLA